MIPRTTTLTETIRSGRTLTDDTITEAELAGVQIIDRLDPDTRRKLLEHIEAGQA